MKQSDGDAEILEVPLEEDDTLTLATLESQYTEAIGLKYRNDETHSIRAVKLADGKFHAPDGSWTNRVYLVVTALRRKDEAGSAEDAAGNKRKADNEEPTATPAIREESEESKRRKQNCYKCGGEGHIQEMCPSPEGSRNSAAPECHLCKGRGHIKVRCPNNVPKGVCYKCGQYGHAGRECRAGDFGVMGGGRMGGDYGYGMQPPPHDMYGHGPQMGMGMGMPGMGMGMGGFQPRFDAGPAGGAGGGDRLCFRCKQPGHQAMNCPRTQSGESANSCYRCGTEGHIARDCDVCIRCKQRGHFISACPQARV